VSTELTSQVTTTFNLDRRWRLDDLAAIRHEPFGAVLYHFGTRKLSFLKSPTLLRVLENLAAHPTARAACAAVGVTESELSVYGRALATLASSNMIVPGTPSSPPTVRPDFWELLDYSIAHQVGVKFSTNGIKLDAAAARRLAASRRPGERAGPADPSTPAAAAAWRPSSSPACRRTDQTRNACAAMARRRWRRSRETSCHARTATIRTARYR
jgi:putative mycofactocin binding protein MftB